MKLKHNTRRSRLLDAEAKKNKLPVSTFVGRGLHRKPRPASTAKPLPARTVKPKTQLFGEVATFNLSTRQDTADDARVKTDALATLKAKPLIELGLSPNHYRVLDDEGIRTIGELIDLTEERLLGIKGVGSKTVDTIKLKLWSQTPPLNLNGEPNPKS